MGTRKSLIGSGNETRLRNRIITVSVVGSLLLYFVSLNLFSILRIDLAKAGSLLTVWNMLCIVLLLFAVAYATRLRALSARYLLLWGLFAISNIATAWVSVSNGGSVLLLNPVQMIPLLLMFLALVLLGGYRLSVELFYKYNKYFIYFVVFSCVYNIVLNYEVINRDLLTIANTYEVEFSSFFLNRNTFGFMLALGLAATILQITKLGRGSGKRATYVAFLLLIIPSIVLTMSRGALLLSAIFIILYGFIRHGLRGLVKVILVLSLAVAACYSLLGAEFIEANIVRPDAGSTGRDVLHEFGMRHFMDNSIVFGSGVGVPSNELEKVSEYRSFHSYYISILVEGGILLAVAYLLLIVMVFRILHKIHRRDKTLGAFFLSLLIGYLLYGLVESNILFRYESVSILATLYLVIIPIFLCNGYAPTKANGRTLVGEAYD